MAAPTPGGYPGARFSRGSDMLINALPDYGITGTLGNKVVLQEAPDINAPNFRGIGGAANGYFAIDAVLFGQRSGNYHQILDPTGAMAALQLGNATDPTNYYNNTTHTFRNRALSTIATLSFSGSNAALTAAQTNANFNLSGNGTGVVDINKGQLSGGRLVRGIYILAASAVAVPLTGSTTETTLVTIAVPANAMGANGQLRISAALSHSGGAGTFTPRIKFGGTAFYDQVAFGSTTLSSGPESRITNRNATNSQIGVNIANMGGNAIAPVTSSIDTTSSQNISITGQLGSAADTMTLESYLVELIVP